MFMGLFYQNHNNNSQMTKQYGNMNFHTSEKDITSIVLVNNLVAMVTRSIHGF